MPFSTEWAPTHDELNACVECGLCLPHCPTFRLTGDESASPRGRLNAMVAVSHGDAAIDPTFDEIMSFCLQCRACEAACPSLVPFGRAMEGARAELAEARPRGRRLRLRIAGRVVPGRQWMRLMTIGAAIAQRLGAWVVPKRFRSGFAGLRRLPFRRHSILGYESGTGMETVGILAGCVMDPWFTRVHDATIAVLEAARYHVVVPENQGCCGALAAHEGAASDAARLAADNARAFAGLDHVVANAAGCSGHISGYGHWGAQSVADRSVDAVRLIARSLEAGSLPMLDGSGSRVAVHDPCHHRHVQGIAAETRRVLRAAGLDPVDVDPSGMCCGAAGMYSVNRPDTAAKLGGVKGREIEATGCDLVATANPGCEIQLRAHTEGVARLAHPIELYAEAHGLIPQDE